jgi:hypothetical protein
LGIGQAVRLLLGLLCRHGSPRVEGAVRREGARGKGDSATCHLVSPLSRGDAGELKLT